MVFFYFLLLLHDIGQLNEQNNTNTEQSIELGQLQGDLQALQQELTLAGKIINSLDVLLLVGYFMHMLGYIN